MRRLIFLCSGLALAGVAGCATDRSGDAFADVRETVADRGGYAVAWDGVEPPNRSALYDDLLGDGALDADEAVQLALLNNAGLQADLDALGIAGGELLAASLLPNPMLDASVRFVEGGGGEIIELGLAQNVLDALLIPRRRAVASQALAMTQAEAAAAVLDLAAETRTAYRRYQAQLARVELYENVVDATYLAADMARRLRAAGNVIELDVLQEEALYQDARLRLAEAQGESMRRRDALAALLGLWGETAAGWSVPPRLPEPEPLDVDAATLVPEVLANSLDLEARRRQVNVVARQAGVRSFESILPDLDAGADAEREADGEWSIGPAIGVGVPIFNFGQGVRTEYHARLRQAMNRYAAEAVRLRAETRSAYTTAATTANTSRYLREVLLPLRNDVTQQTQLQFNAMQVGVFRLLDAKRDEIDAAERYLTALEDHWSARIRLETLQMGRLPQSRFGIDAGGSGGDDMPTGDSPAQGGH